MEPRLSLAQYLEDSTANGPGHRAVIWLYGCEQNCTNCCNPRFREFIAPDTDIETFSYNLINDIKRLSLRGITLSGGEPFHPTHIEAIKKLIKLVRQQVPIDVMVFSGYKIIPEWAKDYVDLVIAGPYIDELRHDRGLIASTNQKIVRFTDRFDDISDDEIINGERIIEAYISNSGDIIFSGLIGKNEIERI